MAVNTSQNPGLTSAQVAERVARGETNAFKVRVGRTTWQILKDNIFNLFNIVLFILLIIILFFKDYSTAVFASTSVILNSVVGTLQELAAKRQLDKLAALAAQQVKVWRDGKLITVPMPDIVKDDVIPVEPGDRIIVDGHVLQADALEMDESLLTGESDPVQKEHGDTLFSGSFCIAGSGLMVATQVGANSTVNRLAKTAKTYRNVQTPTQRKITAIVEVSVFAMLLFGPLVILTGYINTGFKDEADLLETVRNAVVTVTSFVPQGTVLVATVSLTLGALAISRRQTLVQRMNAVESLANTDTLCFDKTGTLTRNELAVTNVMPLNGDSLEAIHEQLRIYTGNLAYQNKTSGAIAKYLAGSDSGGGMALVKTREVPFSSARKWGAVVFTDHTLILGAPERVLEPAHSQEAIHHAKELAAQGQRVLALASSTQEPTNGRLHEGREPIALIVMSDQIRTDIKETLDAFYALNVDLKVISGDNPETVSAIAATAGVRVSGATTGDKLEAMSNAEFEATVQNTNIFARIEPETKRKIVAALKRAGHYVAMTGDGVNDVPALKEAHLAIVMNDGAQIAKDVADIVLLNNAMSTLPLAFAEGKTITQKIFGTCKLFLIKNIYTIILFICVGFLTLPFPIGPIQISWLIFGTINIPSVLLAFGLYRPAHMAKFREDVLDYVIGGGAVAAMAELGLYAFVYLASRDPNANPDLARDIARSALTIFLTLFGIVVFWNMNGIDMFKVRTFWERKWMTALGAVLGALTILSMYLVPDLFSFVPPTLGVWAMIAVMSVITITAMRYVLKRKLIVSSVWQLAEA